MYAERFGDTYSTATVLPFRRPDQDVGTDMVAPSNILVAGGAFNSAGEDTTYPQGRTVAVRGVIVSTSAATLLSTMDALRAWRGKWSTLWLLCNDSTTRWRKARMLEVRQPLDVHRRYANVQEAECVFELDGSGVWKGSDGTATIDLTSTSVSQTVTNDGNTDCRDTVIRVKNWLQNTLSTPNKVWFYDDSLATWTDLTSTYDDSTGTSNTIPAMQTADRLYIGYTAYPFCQVTFNLSTPVNNNAATMQIQLYNGSWSSLTTFIEDGTASGGASFAQDGVVRWIRQAMTLTTVNGSASMYWIRIYFDAALDDVLIVEIDVTRFADSMTVFSSANRTPDHQSKITYTGTITNLEEIEIDCGSSQVRMYTTPDEVKWYDASVPSYTDMVSGKDDDVATFATFSTAAFATADYLYVGDSATFDQIRLSLGIAAGNQNTARMTAEYYNGSTWVELAGLIDGTASGGKTWNTSGTIKFVLPSDWATVVIDSDTKYWVRISTSAVWSNGMVVVPIAEIDIRLTANLWANLAMNAPPHSIDQWLRLTNSSNYLAVTRTGGSPDTDLLVEFEDTYA